MLFLTYIKGDQIGVFYYKIAVTSTNLDSVHAVLFEAFRTAPNLPATHTRPESNFEINIA